MNVMRSAFFQFSLEPFALGGGSSRSSRKKAERVALPLNLALR